MSQTVAVRVVVEGRVQGVWFRAWTVREATSRRLAGWVRNRRDGSVEALFAGSDSSVREMVDLCWQGPPAAEVSTVTETPAAPPSGAGFTQLPTA